MTNTLKAPFPCKELLELIHVERPLPAPSSGLSAYLGCSFGPLKVFINGYLFRNHKGIQQFPKLPPRYCGTERNRHRHLLNDGQSRLFLGLGSFGGSFSGSIRVPLRDREGLPIRSIIRISLRVYLETPISLKSYSGSYHNLKNIP